MQNFFRQATPHDPSGLADAVRVLSHPDEVLSHPDLTASEKREVLAAWASDAHAVPDQPGLRQLDSGAIVSVDEVFRSLRALDCPPAVCGSEHRSTGFERRRRPSRGQLVFVKRRDDDDDDPPSPAAALPLGLAAALRRKWETGAQPEPVAA